MSDKMLYFFLMADNTTRITIRLPVKVKKYLKHRARCESQNTNRNITISTILNNILTKEMNQDNFYKNERY